MAHPPATAIAFAGEAARRAAIVERVLRTADELERLARAPSARPSVAVVTRGGAVRLASGEHVLLGRAPRCDVRLSSPRASREHAVLLHRGGAWWVEDLDSSNGTFLDGERIALRRLRDGDVLVLADEPVRVKIG